MSVFLDVDRAAFRSLNAAGWKTGLVPPPEGGGWMGRGDSFCAYDERGCRIEAPTVGELVKRCAAHKCRRGSKR